MPKPRSHHILQKSSGSPLEISAAGATAWISERRSAQALSARDPWAMAQLSTGSAAEVPEGDNRAMAEVQAEALSAEHNRKVA